MLLLEYWPKFYYKLTPVRFYGDSGKIYQYACCTQCNCAPLAYAGSISAENCKSGEIACGTGDTGAEAITVKVTFGFIIEGVSVEVTVDVSWYRYVTEDYFYICYHIFDTKKDTMYRWHHEGDSTSYIVHFSWG